MAVTRSPLRRLAPTLPRRTTALLGVEELPDGKLGVQGIAEPARVRQALWDGLNNRQRVNVNLLREQDVEILVVDEKPVVRITVPRASRRQRPVYVGQNPLTGSFRRNNEGDYRCPEEVVRRMIAEQVEDTRDARILRGCDLGDLDPTTITKYRQRYQTRSPDHPWNFLDEKDFLRSIGAHTSSPSSDSSATSACHSSSVATRASTRRRFTRRCARRW